MTEAAPHWRAPGSATASAFLMTVNADEVLALATNALGGAIRRQPLRRADGTVWNAEVTFDESTVMVAGVSDAAQAMPGFVHLYVPDADAAFSAATAAGAEPVMPVTDQFYGDRAGGVRDAGGNIWWVATHRETIDADELERRAREHERTRDDEQKRAG